jgi:hypothetical protein
MFLRKKILAGKVFCGKKFWREKILAGKVLAGKKFWREKFLRENFGGKIILEGFH